MAKNLVELKNTGFLVDMPTKALILSTLFAYCFIFILPWDSIHDFPDIHRYIARANKILIPGYHEEVWSKRPWITAELLWKQYLLLVGPYLDDYPLAISLSGEKTALLLQNGGDASLLIIRISSFIALYIFARFAFTNARAGITLMLFFNPVFIDLIMSQLRTAIACAILYLAMQSKSIFIKILLAIIAVSLHTSSILIIAMYIALLFLAKSAPVIRPPIAAIFIAAATAFSLKFLAPIALTGFGDSRLSGMAASESSSVLFSSLWAAIGLVIAADCLWRKKSSTTNYDIVAISGTALLFFCSLISIYGVRYLAFCMPALCVSISHLPRNIYAACIISIAAWQSIQYYYWL